MSDRFQLRVVTPTSEAVNEEVFEVTAPGTMGEFGILPDHAAFLSSLEVGRLHYRGPSGENQVAIREGFAEVSDNVMTVLSEAAATKADVDMEETTAQLQEAKRKLEDLSTFDPEFAEAQADMHWAEARLAVAGIR